MTLLDQKRVVSPKLSRFIESLLYNVKNTSGYHVIRTEKRASIESEELPKVTFAIPTYNSAAHIVECLTSIRSQDYENKEILIIDGFSEDSTVNLSEQYTNKILFCDGPLGICRQKGFENSTGSIVAMFDCDLVIPHRNWLRSAVMKFIDAPNVSTVWPLTVAPDDASLFSKAFINFAWAYMLGETAKGLWMGGGGHSLFRKSLVEEVGGIDIPIHYGEDFYLASKLARRGYKVVMNEDPLYHLTHSSPSIWLQKERQRSKDFRKAGYDRLTGYSANQLAVEQLKAVIKSVTLGPIIDGDVSWLLVPLLVLTRALTAFS